MRDVLDLVVVDVESITLRSVAGDGDQVALTIATRRGALTLRLLGRRERVIRLVDLRQRDKRRRTRGPFVSVPFAGREDAR